MRKTLKYLVLVLTGWLLINSSLISAELLIRLESYLEFGSRGWSTMNVVWHFVDAFPEVLSGSYWQEGFVAMCQKPPIVWIYYSAATCITLAAFVVWLALPNFVTAAFLAIAGFLGGPLMLAAGFYFPFLPYIFPFVLFLLGGSFVAQMLWGRIVRFWRARSTHAPSSGS